MLIIFRYSIIGIYLYFHSCHDAFYISIGLIIQGFISYWSDVHTLGFSSISHILDTFLATTLFVLCFFYAIDVIRRNMLTSAQKYIAICMFIVGFFCKIQGTKYLRQLNKSMYKIWHIMWHISIPLPTFFILFTQKPCYTDKLYEN